MKKYKFRKNDKVIIKKIDADDIAVNLKIGMTGTVINESNCPYVIIDNWNGGHDLPYEYNLICDESHKIESSCWAFYEDQLDLI